MVQFIVSMNTPNQSSNTPPTTNKEKSLNAEHVVQKNNDDGIPNLIDQPLGWTVDIPENLSILARKKDIDKLKQESSSDKLTGLFNRRGLEQELDKVRKTLLGEEKYERRAGIEKNAYVLLVLDIDKFKSFNDTYGHHVGDEVLKLSGEFLQNHFRPTDAICRFGGEEFVILLTDNNKNNFVERMGKRLSDDGKEEELRTLNFPIKILEEEIKNDSNRNR